MKGNQISALDPTGSDTLHLISKAQKFNRWMYSHVRPHLVNEVLEIGSGIGNISRFAVEDGFSITLSDLNDDYLSLLKKEFEGCENVRSITGIDLLHPSFDTQFAHLKEKFSSVFMLNVLEHISNESLAIRNLRRLISVDGKLVILVPAIPFLYCDLDRNLGHHKRYSKKELERLLGSQGFSVSKSYYFNTMGIAGWWLYGKIFRRKSLGDEMSVFNRMVPAAKLLDKIFAGIAGLSLIVIATKNNS